MLNRVAAKESAKKIMQVSGNQSGMIGLEILYKVISTATVTALGSIILVISSVGGGLSWLVSSPFMLLNPIAWFIVLAVLCIAVGMLMSIASVMMQAPFNVARQRYYLYLQKNHIRTSALSIFESFDFFMQFGIVAGVKVVAVNWFPLVLILAGAVVALILLIINAGLGVALGGFLVFACCVAAIVIQVYKNLVFWPMEMVQADHPSLTAKQVMDRCREMTKGHIGDLLVFELSFLGWDFLSLITGGIVGLLYSTPYYFMSKALVYAELKGRPIALDGIRANISGDGLTIGIKPSDLVDIRKDVTGPVKPEPKPNAFLKGITGMYAGSSFPLEPDRPVILGRDGTMAQIVFSQGAQKISRRHCEIVFDSRTQQYRVTDFSSNGTYVKGTNTRLAVNTPMQLARGTEIYLGDTNNIIRLG